MIQNDDQVVWSEMLDLAAAGGAAQFPVLAPGTLKFVAIGFGAAPNAQVTLSLLSKHGIFRQSIVLANALSASGSYMFEIDPFDRANNFDAGDQLTILTDGGGSTGGIAHIAAIFRRG